MGRPSSAPGESDSASEKTPPQGSGDTPTPPVTPLTMAEKLAAARAGSRDALGELFDECRNYLLLIANSSIGNDLRARVAASDVVQETFLEAGQIIDRFTGSSEEELLRWLTRILEHKLGNTYKGQLWSAKRDPYREVRLGDSDHVEFFEGLFVDAGTSPSGVVAADEETWRLRNLIAQLPADYQRVIQLRVYERKAFEDVGQVLNRSADAARKLFVRAIVELRARIKRDDHPPDHN